MFNETHYQQDNGRHVVAIPLKSCIKELGSSREIALKRFFMLEKRANRDPEYWQQYMEFMREYEGSKRTIEARRNGLLYSTSWNKNWTKIPGGI